MGRETRSSTVSRPARAAWPEEWKGIFEDPVEVIRQARVQRGVRPDMLDNWRSISMDPSYKISEMRSVLRYCVERDWHPQGLTALRVAEYLNDKGLGSAGTKSHLTAVNNIRRHGFGQLALSGKVNADVYSETRSAAVRTAGIRQAQDPAVSKVAEGEIEPNDLRLLLDFVRAQIVKAGGLRQLAVRDLIDYTLCTVKSDVMLRHTGVRNLPLYAFRREPPGVELPQCERFWVASVDTKEVRLGSQGSGWSKEVMVSQDPTCEDPTKLSLMWSELRHRMTSPEHGGRGLPGVRHYGRKVEAKHVFIQRRGRQQGKDCRWLFGEPLSDATIAKRISVVAARVRGLVNFLPSHIRHTAATYFYWAWAVREEKGGWSLDDLRRRMRHASALTTERHYIQRGPAPSVVVRWEEVGYEMVGTTSELVRGKLGREMGGLEEE
jgi:hypothetical protein